jgi:hypothetical protein
VARFMHQEKAPSPIVVTPSGILMDFISQPAKARLPMAFRPAGREMELKDLQLSNALSPIPVTYPSSVAGTLIFLLFPEYLVITAPPSARE